MRDKSGGRGGLPKRDLTILLVSIAVVVSAVLIISRLDSLQYSEVRGTSTSNIGQRKRVEYEGHSYAQKTNMTAILVLGVDKENEEDSYYSARMGGQADFLLLVVIDHNTKTISRLQLDRDTMTEVEMLGPLGQSVGTRIMQISLSHNFGKTPQACCHTTAKAVDSLLGESVIDYYFSLNMNAMQEINHLLGGVTVTLEQDFSANDPAMFKGATLKLTDEQAEIYLHSRQMVGEGTNSERMSRHRTYMDAAADMLLKDEVKAAKVIGEMFNTMSSDIVTNIDSGTLLNEANVAKGYNILPVETLSGEHVIGDDGYMHFYVAEGETQSWVIQTFYDLLN